ncbi:helix-turn-helix domain-containing protein [Nocardiopsis sp. NPDC049922]|uniref:winged helix-turn-helix transcriptional regulator n=1 Tax=Nocardiopsis sp. NPDC049922 TaxID=3155157 RepID=UPI0033E870B1
MVVGRSDCPINRGVELLGDRWSLVIMRDIVFSGRRGFREILTNSRERITAPTLSRHLAALVEMGFLSHEPAPRGKAGRYTLTEAGIRLVPLLFELAAIGHLLDPTTFSTEPRFDGWYGDATKIAQYQDELRDLHLA